VEKRLRRSRCRDGVVGRVGPRNGILDGHAHWRHLANTVEQLHTAAMSGSAATLTHNQPNPNLTNLTNPTHPKPTKDRFNQQMSPQ